MKQSHTGWGIGHYAEGARGSRGPVGEERISVNAARPGMLSAMQELFAAHALAKVAAESENTTPEPEQTSA
jgi:hypothetical protein